MGTLLLEGMVGALRGGSRVLGTVVGPSGGYQDIQIFYPGEPFFDANHNGRFDIGEDHIDIYQRDADGSPTGFEGVWNDASDGTGDNPMPTVYFGLDDSGPDGGIIKKGTEESDSVFWDMLYNGATKGSIWVDGLAFHIRPDGRSVQVALTIRSDMGSNDLTDDISMDFSSSVNLRE